MEGDPLKTMHDDIIILGVSQNWARRLRNKYGIAYPMAAEEPVPLDCPWVDCTYPECDCHEPCGGTPPGL